MSEDQCFCGTELTDINGYRCPKHPNDEIPVCGGCGDWQPVGTVKVEELYVSFTLCPACVRQMTDYESASEKRGMRAIAIIELAMHGRMQGGMRWPDAVLQACDKGRAAITSART